MTEEARQQVYEALVDGEWAEARHYLRMLAKQPPSADFYYYSAFLAPKRSQATAVLRKALELDNFHPGANRLLMQIEDGQVTVPVKATLPDAPYRPAQRGTAEARVITERDIQRKRQRLRQVGRRPWSRSQTLLVVFSSLLLSLSSSWLVLLLLGVGSAYTNPMIEAAGGQQSIRDYNGTPIAEVEYPARLSDLPATYNSVLERGGENATGEILRDRALHEYTVIAVQGESLAIAVQFFSPFAEDVYPNVAILDPTGIYAEDRCRREIIIDAQTGAAFVCSIHISGSWQVRIFGDEGKSSGVYVVTADALID
jgi:hypothetical protein